MAAINFPESPNENDVFTSGRLSWKWTGVVWKVNTLNSVTGGGGLGSSGSPYAVSSVLVAGGGAGGGAGVGGAGAYATGGGGGASGNTTGGSGGSGVVVLWYQNATQLGSGGNIIGSFVNGGNTYWGHVFTASGIYTA